MTSTFLPTYQLFPVQKPAELERVLVKAYTDIALQLNLKENAQYELFETNDGQQFYDLVNPKIKRFVYRKAFETGAIPTATVIDIAHGITGITDFVNIYGTVATDVPDWRPFPCVGPWGTDLLSVWVTPTLIHIETGQTFPNILSGRVILEYLKN